MQSFAFCVNTKQTSAGQSDKHAQQVQSCSVLLILLSCKVCSAIKFFERSASASAFRSTHNLSNVRPISCAAIFKSPPSSRSWPATHSPLPSRGHRSRPHPSNCKPQQMLVTTHHLTCQHALAELPATWIVGSPPSNGRFVE